MATQQNRLKQRQADIERELENESTFSACQQRMEETIRESPIATTMMVFGVGFGVGAMIGAVLADPVRHARRGSDSQMRRLATAVREGLTDSFHRHFSS